MASHLTNLDLSLLICKTRIINIPTSRHCCGHERIKWGGPCKDTAWPLSHQLIADAGRSHIASGRHQNTLPMAEACVLSQKAL